MPTDISKPVLLLVEDSEDDAFFFRRTFQKSGADWRIHHALNGASAIEFLRDSIASATRPVIIFLDLKMPVLNGFDVLTWMQKENLTSVIPVIVLSGSDQQKDKDRVFELGAADYLAKPLRLGDLQRFLQHSLAPANHPSPVGSGVVS